MGILLFFLVILVLASISSVATDEKKMRKEGTRVYSPHHGAGTVTKLIDNDTRYVIVNFEKDDGYTITMKTSDLRLIK